MTEFPPLAEQAVDGLDTDTLTRPPRRGPTPSPGWYGTWPGCRTITWLSSSAPISCGPKTPGPVVSASTPIRPKWLRPFVRGGARRPARQVLRSDGYLGAVSARTRTALLETIGPDDLDLVVDRRWDPPVTLGVRLVSIADDNLQHAGQANYVRGLLGV